MKKLLLVAFCCCLAVAALAQTTPQTVTVKGLVIDSVSNKPLSYVTVALQDAKTQQPVKAGLTRDDGSFALKAAADNTYQLVLVSIGYKNKIIKLNGTGSDIDAGRILLSASSSQLKEVSVTAARPMIKQEVDRIAYDVQADPDSKALSALDMMRKVPLLSVDGNDNIRLKGSGNYKILVNGRESALFTKNPSDVLKSMPATNVEKIEVITTPPAKYDAEGLAGIINIITKKNADQGYNMGFNSRFNSVYGPGYNVNGTLKEGKFGMSMFVGLGSNGRQVNTSGSFENIFASQTNINQTGTTTQTGHFHYVGTELSYELDSLNLLTASLNLFGNNQTQGNDQVSTTDSLNVEKQGYTLQNSGTSSFTGLDVGINYQLGFKKSKDKFLTLSYKFSYSPNKQFNDNLFSGRFDYPVAFFPDYQQYNDAGNKDHTVQIDYASPLNKQFSIEAGAKAILRNNYSNFDVSDRDPATQQFVTNDAQTNDFNYHQDIYSLYNSYQLKLDKWTGKAGLRLEYTSLNADFISAGVTTAPNYGNLIPSVSIQRTFKTSSVNFGFTQRIQRPGIYQLNPFVDRSNPTFVNTGNPALKPELDNTFELTYSNFTKNAINVGLSYAFSNNSIQNVSNLQTETINNKTDTVTYTTFENLGTNKTVGLNVNTNMNFTKRFSLSLNGQVNHIWLSGTFDGAMYHNDGYMGNAFGNTRYRFDNGFALSFNAGYFSGNINLQGKSSDFIFNQYLVSKDFFNKKLTLVLVANNPYYKYKTFSNTINSVDFYQTSFNQNYYRSLAFRINFRFGKLNSQIKKNEHGIENDDTKGGGKSASGSGN
jgi:hypothetical protein